MALLIAQVPQVQANNIQVSNATLTGNTGTYAMVQFDLSWENSWRGGGLPNWDAAWVFVKYRDVSNVWHHAYLGDAGHVVPSGSGAGISTGLVEVGAAYNPVADPVVGAFVHRGIPGSGTFSLIGVQLRWNYADQGVAYADIDDIGVFGIEMVYVPQGPYMVGQNTTGSRYERTYINTANASVVPTGNGGPLLTPQGGHAVGETPPAADKPNGFRAFYCMKYELSQQTYADYLNLLTYSEQVLRTAVMPTSPTGTPALNGSARNSIVVAIPATGFGPAQYGCDLNGNTIIGEVSDGGDIPVNWINGEDYMAFLDWSGLRPLSTMEFEKACRGPNLPVTNEYAWGNALVANTPYLLSSAGSAAEGVNIGYRTDAGNANYVLTSSAFDGPARSGLFAAHPSNANRMTAGVSYYGIMELSGNLRELVGSLNDDFNYSIHGNGVLSAAAEADAFDIESGSPSGIDCSGGDFTLGEQQMRVSAFNTGTPSTITRVNWAGIRGVRSAP